MYLKTITSVFTMFMIGACHGFAPPVRCNGYFCSRGEARFPCSDEDLVCCGGASPNDWHVIPAVVGLQCCDGTGDLYSIHDEICINGTKRPKLTRNEEMCGLTASYDSGTQTCCLRDVRFGIVYDKVVGAVCCNETYLTGRDTDCCEGIAFSPSRQTCCPNGSGHVLHDVPNGHCCLDTPYDPAIKKCGENGVQLKDEGELERCGGVPYNSQTDICCLGQTRSRSSYLCYTRGRKPVIVAKSSYLHNAVCMDHNYRLVTFYTGPDGRRVCIDRVGIKHLAANEEICKGAPNKVYDTNEHLCCAGAVYHPHGRRDGKKCCDNGTRAYNPLTETCCRNNVRRNVSENDGGRCCGMHAYNNNTQQCTESRDIVDVNTDSGRVLTPEALENLRDSFHNGGLLVYVATVSGESSKSKKWRQWGLVDVEQLKSKKKKKVAFGSVRGRVAIRVYKSFGVQELVDGQRYIIFVSNKVRGGKLSLKKTTDVIVPLANAEALGHFWQVILSSDV